VTFPHGVDMSDKLNEPNKEDEKSLVKITNKYLCMASGQKLMEPCQGCSNPKGCLSRAMQYKETEEMDSIEEKAVVKVDADGGVVACAKGLDVKECGFKGGKVCGACGAMAVSSKASGEPLEKPNEMYSDEMNDVLEERMEEDEEKRREFIGAKDDDSDIEEKMSADKPKLPVRDADVEAAMSDDEEEDEEEKEKKAENEGEMPEEDEEDEEDVVEDEEEKAAMPKENMDMEMDEEEEEDGKGYGMMKPRKRSRALAMKSLGVKSEDFAEDEDAFLCQIDRKCLSGNSAVCDNCPGGCSPEEGMPGILDIEGMALEMFGGKVLSSGYADEADLFIVDILSKDGQAFEIIADGTTGEVQNFHRLNNVDLDNIINQKSLDGAESGFVDIRAAQEIALKTLESELGISGQVVEADSDIFEGYDSYVFEIDGANGKSYDLFVGLDGTTLGWDEYDASEAEDIEAEAAELALKRMYDEDERAKMAKGGMALPDGSFPIKDVEDLKNAIQAFGRAKDKKVAKEHIIKRALDLGQEDLIPENWVPKKAQEEAQAAEKTAESEFLASVMEFEMLTAEEELRDLY